MNFSCLEFWATLLDPLDLPLGDPPHLKFDLPPAYPLNPLFYPLKKKFNILGGLFDPTPEKDPARAEKEQISRKIED